MTTLPEQVDTDVQLRLRRIEGQVRGIIGMLSEGKPCEQVVAQILAARAAMDRVAMEVLKCQVSETLGDETSADAREKVIRTIELLNKVR